MVLRKPYAFFIKHFKLMHVILAILVCYSIVKTKELLDFFNEYSTIIINVKGQDLVTPLLPWFFQFVSILIIIISIVILIVMSIKNKPYLFYIILIGVFIYNTVLLQVSKFTLTTLTNGIVDTRTILLLRDLIMICFLAQLVEVVIVFVRATGFDVRKFNFDADLKQLNVTEADREEVEIQINFDGNKLIRNIRRQIRFLKYTYKENKKLANIAITSFSVAVIASVIVLIVSNKIPIINQNVYFTGNNFTISVLDSYLTNTDYKGNLLTDDYYLLLRVNVKSNIKKNMALDIATTKILIDNYVYTPTTQFKDSFSDFGYVYQGEEIGQEYEEKILVYQIPKELIKKEMIFSFVDKNSMDEEGEFASTKIKINYEQLVGIDSNKTSVLSNELSFEDSILKGTKIKINGFDIQKEYKLSYSNCVNQKCHDSYEYIVPSVNSNYDKVILKIDGIIEFDKKLNGIYDLYDFIHKFAQLSYVINGQEKIQQIDFKEVNSQRTNQHNNYYIEVVNEVMNAEKISLIFTIRNKSYEYVLK